MRKANYRKRCVKQDVIPATNKRESGAIDCSNKSEKWNVIESNVSRQLNIRPLAVLAGGVVKVGQDGLVPELAREANVLAREVIQVDSVGCVHRLETNPVP